VKTLHILTAFLMAIAWTASSGAAPLVFMYAGGGHALTENAFPYYEDCTNYGTISTLGEMKEYAYYIHNLGDTNLTVNSVIITNLGQPAFSLGNLPGGTVAPNTFTIFSVRFQPPVVGAHPGKVTVTTNDPQTPAFDINIGGTGAVFGRPQPDLKPGAITAVKAKTKLKNGVNYLTATYMIPIENVGQGIAEKKVPVLRAFASSNRILDSSDLAAPKTYPLKKELPAGSIYFIKAKIKMPLPAGSTYILFQLTDPADYETHYNNNLQNIAVP